MSRRRGALPAQSERTDAAETMGRHDIPPQELRLRQLRTPWEIGEIEHLRRQIRLPAATLADPGFAALEKKGTKPASSPRWRSGARSSAP